MRLKTFLLSALACCLLFSAEASVSINSAVHVDVNSPTYINSDLAKLTNGDLNAFLNMTPKQFEKATGKKLSLKETLKLKAAQKMLKRASKDGDQIPKGLFIVLAIFGWAWLAMGIMDDWEGKNWYTNLILTLLCGIPGLIHALVHLKDYYGSK